MSTWSLPEQAQRIASAAREEGKRRVAETMYQNYRPLVELMVISSEGELLGRLRANEDIFDLFGPDQGEQAVEYLLAFLKTPSGVTSSAGSSPQ